MRKLGVNYRTAWLLHSKIMQAMNEREKSYVLRGKVQNDRRDGLPQQQAPQGHEIERVNAGGHGPQHRSGGDFGSGFPMQEQCSWRVALLPLAKVPAAQKIASGNWKRCGRICGRCW